MSKPDAASPREDNARALATGFISALSAVIGRRSSALGLAVSQMTTWPGSRTQMNAALSIVTVVKLMALAATPSAGSCRAKEGERPAGDTPRDRVGAEAQRVGARAAGLNGTCARGLAGRLARFARCVRSKLTVSARASAIL